MKTIYHTPATILLICSPLMLWGQKSVFTFPFENQYRLPALHTRINMDEIASTYQTMENIYTTEISGVGDETMEHTSMSFMSDAKVVDAVRFLERYMDDELVAKGNQSDFLLEMSVVYYHQRGQFHPGAILGIFTFGIATLCGVPTNTNVVDIEIEACLYNPSDIMIKQYRGVGRGKKAQNIFNSTTRKAHQKAITDALNNLNTKIMNDSTLVMIQPMALVNL